MDKSRLNLRNVAIACLTATVIFASCKKDTPDLNGTVTITPTANVLTGDELTAAYSGTETVTWQWNKGGTAISGATSNKYTPTEAGSYTATASAKGYNSKTSAAVEVRLAIFLLEERQRDGMRYVYEYDDQDRITKVTASAMIGGQIHSVETFKYNIISGVLEEWKKEYPLNPENNEITVYSKNDNKISFEMNSERYVFDLNVQGLIENYSTKSNDESGYIGTFTWHNGNLTKIEWKEVWKENGEEKYSPPFSDKFEHDDKKSPFYHCKTPKWFLWFNDRGQQNENNIKTETFYGVAPITCVYEYNADGFPAKRTRGTTTETYKYLKR